MLSWARHSSRGGAARGPNGENHGPFGGDVGIVRQRAALEDLGETPGRSGEISLVPGPYVPAQMGEADVQLVAVVTGRGVAEGAGLGPHARGPEQPGQRIGGGDPRVPRRPETAPGGVEEEVAAHRALPGEHRLDPAGVRTHQHVAMQEITVDQVPALRAGIHQGPHPLGDRRGKGGQFLVASQGGAPSVEPASPRGWRRPGRAAASVPAAVRYLADLMPF
jgi:hypothetical protein